MNHKNESKNLTDIKMSVHMLARTFFENLNVTVKSGMIDMSYSCRCGITLASYHVWKWGTQTNLPDMTLNYENLEASECTDPDFKLFYEWLQSTILTSRRERRKSTDDVRERRESHQLTNDISATVMNYE